MALPFARGWQRLPDREDRLPWEPGYDGPEGQRTLFDPPPADAGTL